MHSANDSKHKPLERKHRLSAAAYTGQVSVAFTACVVERRPVFQSGAIVETMVRILACAAERYRCSVSVYTFMPDHAHFVLTGRSSDSDTLSAMKLFKQRAGFHLASIGLSGVLPKDFHDHVLGSRSEFVEAVLYIVMNPVRGGLVGDWRQYPFTGSIGCDLSDVVVSVM